MLCIYSVKKEDRQILYRNRYFLLKVITTIL
nr:MAG TPA: hypothetical protein [Caudoviricetes sp.]